MQELTMQELSGEETSSVNTLNILNAPNISKILIKILTEEKKNREIIKHCYNLIYQMLTNRYSNIYQHYVEIARKEFLKCKIIEALMSSVEPFLSRNCDDDGVLSIFFHLAMDRDNIPRLITAGLLKVLVQIANSPNHHQSCYHQRIIRKLFAFDNDIMQQLYELGIPEGSDFFRLYWA
jgi:hypothetical protein